MTPKQRSYFFADLWPKACRVQGWTGKVDQEVKRRAVVYAATSKLRAEVKGMKPATERMSECDQDQLTAVFNAVKLLIKPLDLKAARRVENPAEVVTQDKRERLIFKIQEGMKRGDYNYAYVQKIADWNLRKDQVADWMSLSEEELKTVLIHLNNRANEKDPNVQRRGSRPRPAKEDQTVYQMRPPRKFVPKPKPVLVPTVSEARHGEDDNIPY